MERDAISIVGQPFGAAPGFAAARPAVAQPVVRPTEASGQTSQQTAGDQRAIQRATERANQALAQKSRELTFEFNEDVDRVVVKLIDKRTGEVLRQFPSEELLAIARALESDASGGVLLRTDS